MIFISMNELSRDVIEGFHLKGRHTLVAFHQNQARDEVILNGVADYDIQDCRHSNIGSSRTTREN
jgi:hypothetical protein